MVHAGGGKVRAFFDRAVASPLSSTTDWRLLMKSFLLAVACSLPMISFAAAPTASLDIGQVAAAGSTSITNGVYTVRASGADIWERSDEFRFVYGRLSRDGEITARVDSVSATDPWTKAGVMIRETLSASSRYAYALVSPSNGVAFHYRASTGGSAVREHARSSDPCAVLGSRAAHRQRVHGVRLRRRTRLATAGQQHHERHGRRCLCGACSNQPS